MSGEAPRGALAGLERAELGERLGGFVYGTIVVLSVIVTGLRAFPHGLWDVAVLVAVTTVVFWLAHVYAHGIAFSIGHDEHLSLKELDHIGRREASIVGRGSPARGGTRPRRYRAALGSGCDLARLRTRPGRAGGGGRRVRPGGAPGTRAGRSLSRSSPTWRSAWC